MWRSEEKHDVVKLGCQDKNDIDSWQPQVHSNAYISFIVVNISRSFCQQYLSQFFNCIFCNASTGPRGDWLKANCEGENMMRTNRDVKIRLTGDIHRSPVYFFIQCSNSVFLSFCISLGLWTVFLDIIWTVWTNSKQILEKKTR